MNKISSEVSQGIEHELEALWRFALKLTGNRDEAADLVQRTCLRALERGDRYVPEGKLRSWLFRIEHRIWLNELRSRQIRNHRSFSADSGVIDEKGVEGQLTSDSQNATSPESSVLLQQVHELVESLPEAQRLVMLLVSVEGFTYRESAEILEVPLGTVMSRLARARVEIGKRILEGKNGGLASSSSTVSGVKQ